MEGRERGREREREGGREMEGESIFDCNVMRTMMMIGNDNRCYNVVFSLSPFQAGL